MRSNGATLLLVVAAFWLWIPTRASVGFGNCTSAWASVDIIPPMPAAHVEVCRDGIFAIAYDTVMKNPAWSAFTSTPQQVANYSSGRFSFTLDPDLRALGVEQASVSSAAFNTTWNRGHLAPNRILSYNDVAKKSTFSIANAAPQYWSFNQQEWRLLEDKFFDWVGANSTLHFITGVGYDDRSNVVFSADGVSFPDFYYTLACDRVAGESVAFVGRNVDGGPGTTVMRPVAYVEDVILLGAAFPAACRTAKQVNQSHWWDGGYTVASYTRPTATARSSAPAGTAVQTTLDATATSSGGDETTTAAPPTSSTTDSASGVPPLNQTSAPPTATPGPTSCRRSGSSSAGARHERRRHRGRRDRWLGRWG